MRATAVPVVDNQALPIHPAISAVSRGFAVLPVQHPDSAESKALRKGKRGKAPIGRLVPHGLKDATRDEARVQSWLSRASSMNYGIRLGDGLLVLDADSSATVAHIERLGMPTTLTVRTSKGRHYYLRVPVGVRIKNLNSEQLFGRSLPGDVKGDGGYVVGWGSTHEDGSRYQIVNDSEVAEAPGWLLALLTRPAAQRRRGRAVAVAIPLSPSTKSPQASTRTLLRDTSDGKNKRVHSVVHHLVSLGYADAQIASTILGSPLGRAWRARHGGPHELARTIDSVRRFRQQNPLNSADADTQDPEAWFATLHAHSKYRANHLAVLQTFVEMALRRGPHIIASQSDVRAASGLRSAQRVIERAVRDGWLIRVFVPSRGSRKRTIYNLRVPSRISDAEVVAGGRAQATTTSPPGMRLDSIWSDPRVATLYPTFDALNKGVGKSASELVDLTGRCRATVHRHLRRLVELGLVVCNHSVYYVQAGFTERAARLATRLGLAQRVRAVRVDVLRTRWMHRETRRVWLSQRYGKMDSFGREPCWSDEDIRRLLSRLGILGIEP